MTARFDLEQNMLQYTHLFTALKLMYDRYDTLTDDERMNIILGILELEPLYFDKMWKSFEDSIKDKSI